MRDRLRHRKGRQELFRNRRRTGEEFSVRQDRGGPQAADRAPLYRAGFVAPPAPSPAIGRASACRPESPSKISKIAACASNRSTCKGAAEFSAALSELGVRVVKRSPDLTVTLVNDYLERRLAELNQQRVSDKTPWLLVQPSGAFPLVGPVFSPGDGACWTCLFDRMIRNREIKGFLDRGPARAVAVSPLARNRSDKAPSSLPRSKSPRRSRAAFAPSCNDHIISHDLLGASIDEALRGDAPAMSDLRQQEAARPAPGAGSRSSSGAGAKLVMTSGGYRTVSSRATVARFRKHVSPLTGVVTRLERIEADLPMNTNFHAEHNFSAPAQNVDQLRAGLTGGSFGKGSTAEQAEASALMEAIERYSGIFQGDEIRMTRRFTDFAPGEAILPTTSCCSATRSRAPITRREEPSETQVGAGVRSIPTARIEWSPVWSLRDGRFKYIPTSLLYFFYSGPAAFQADSNGCAAGNTLEEAIVQGFLELVERDAYAIWWYNRTRRAEVDLEPVRRFLRSRSANPTRRHRTQAVGARHHQRSRHSHLCRDPALDAERPGKYRIRFRRAFRSAHRACCAR